MLSPDKSKQATLTRSADDGTATFNISVDARYALIRGGLKDSGFEERQRCVSLRFSDQSRTAFVELQVRVDPFHWAETSIPAKDAPRVRELPVGTFAAPYKGNDGMAYVVSTMDTPDDDGLALEMPSRETLWFPNRHGLTFSGPDGTLVFHVSGDKVLSFDLIRRKVSAKYVEPWK